MGGPDKSSHEWLARSVLETDNKNSGPRGHKRDKNPMLSQRGSPMPLQYYYPISILIVANVINFIFEKVVHVSTSQQDIPNISRYQQKP